MAHTNNSITHLGYRYGRAWGTGPARGYHAALVRHCGRLASASLARYLRAVAPC